MAEIASSITANAGINASLSNTVASLTTPSTATVPASLTPNITFATATGAYRVDLTTTGTISTINLATLVDGLGVSCGFVHIGAIMIQNPTAASGTVTLTLSAPANGFVGGNLITTGITCGQSVAPQAWAQITDGGACNMAFPGGTGTLIQVTTNSGITAISFPICIIGKNS